MQSVRRQAGVHSLEKWASERMQTGRSQLMTPGRIVIAFLVALAGPPVASPRTELLVLWLGGNDFSTPLAKGEPWTRTTLKLAFDKHYRILVWQLRQRLGASGLIIG